MMLIEHGGIPIVVVLVMSSRDRAIKLIKREHREFLARQMEAISCPPKNESQSRQEILRTVASWIEERREAKKELEWLKPV